MKTSGIPYLLFGCLMLVLAGCSQSKYVADGSYLLKKNQVQFEEEKNGETKLTGDHPNLNAGEMEEFIRPAPNLRLKLFSYNRIDTNKYNAQVERKREKYRKKNEKRKTKENKINNERIDKAEANGDSLYRHKVINMKTERLGWREWVRNNMGQPPVLLDTAKVRKADKQIEIYLRKRGFHFAIVNDSMIYNEKRKKAEVHFTIKSGEPYTIRDLKFDKSVDATMLIQYTEMISAKGSLIELGNLLDQDVLDLERNRFSQYLRDEAAKFGFNKNYIGFLVDTTVGGLMADVTMFVKPRIIKDPYDTSDVKRSIEVGHFGFRIRAVTFYLRNPDKASFKNYTLYQRRCAALKINETDYLGRFQLLDTLHIEGKGTFVYNEKPFIDPVLLDKQNFLEIDKVQLGGKDKKFYKEYYVERSYRTMSNLGVFANITPKVIVDPDAPLSNWVLVFYDLMPIKKQSFLFEPRVLNTNGNLGVLGGVSYSNKNLFGGAQKLEISFVGGFEGRPEIVADSTGGQASPFNTVEWGPKMALSFPKLVPFPKKFTSDFSKRSYPKTTINLNVNYQQRQEFKRTLTELGYSWSFQQDKVQKWDIELIKISYVKLAKEDIFIQSLINQNDPARTNSYADHLTTIFSPVYTYNNTMSNRRKNNNLHNIIASLDISGKMLTPLIFGGLQAVGFGKATVDSAGLKNIYGVPYTEFIKVDIQYVASWYINKNHKVVFRTMAGMGFANGNSTSLPYEQAFFAGGSNDIRAFNSQEMAPGSVKTYNDANATVTQIGDTRFEGNVEWRFAMTSLLEGALFVDAGNIWNLTSATYPSDHPSVLKNSSYKEIAVGLGYGIRADFDFLIVRIDASFALHNPHLPVGERWFLSPKTTYYSDYPLIYDSNDVILKSAKPHRLNFNFGIGYPF
ncbi:MAG: BamA/TamA family outer membrane protein [Crocinitomix sp.]|nr:BamA/TamA family outer membrane protein [Crocinitomix sp.]